MLWLYYILLLIFLLAGLASLILTLPGLWLMTACTAVYAILTHFRYAGTKTLIALFLLTIIGEAVELFIGGAATEKSGGSRRSMIGGVIGGIFGGIFLTFVPIPVVSTIVGICLGSFLGAAAFDLLGGERLPHSLKVGSGAAAGRLMGIISKLIFGMVMLLLTLIAAFP